MATIYGDISGIKWEADPTGTLATAVISFTMPAYTASTDNGQLGGNTAAGAYGHGAANDTLETILQNDRKDGKTVDIITMSTALAINRSPGLSGSTKYYMGTPAESTGNLTFNLDSIAQTEIDAASGVLDAPIVIALSVILT